MVIYAVSNNLVQRSAHPELLHNLDSIFADVPGKYLEALLHRRLASIRAAFETFLDLAGQYKQRDAFQFLVKMGATYNWLAVSERGHILLIYAASMGLGSTIRALMDNGCHPDMWAPSSNADSLHRTALVEALNCGYLRCAHLLLKRCDVNKPIRFKSPMTNFEYFLKDLGDIGKLSESGLKLLLEAGADLNKTIVDELISQHGLRVFTHWEWGLSAVDYLFYFHRPLFHKFSLASESARTQNGHLSRAGILLSLEHGEQSLEAYLDGTRPQVNQSRLADIFERLMFEQFIIEDLHNKKKDTNLETVRALLSFGARFGASIHGAIHLVPDILQSFSTLVGDDCDRLQIEAVLYLVENGATVTAKTFSWMARLSDTRPLDLTLGSIKDPRGLGIALTHAAVRNNFEAVEKLLQAGAKLDTEFRWDEWYGRKRTSIIARVILNHQQSGWSHMLDFLIIKGAPVMLSREKPYLHHLLQFTLDNWEQSESAELTERLKYIVGTGYDLQRSQVPKRSLLEACCSAQVFEYLYRSGVLDLSQPWRDYRGYGYRLGEDAVFQDLKEEEYTPLIVSDDLFDSVWDNYGVEYTFGTPSDSSSVIASGHDVCR